MHVHVCVCVCMCVRLSLVHQPTFQVDGSLSGESWVPAPLLAGGPARLTPPGLRKRPTAAAGPHVCLSRLPPALALLTLITPSRQNSQVASLGGGGTSPRTPSCSFPQWISRATMKQKLVPSPFFTQPGVRG